MNAKEALDFVEKSGTALSAAQDMAEKAAAIQEKVAGMAPKVVDSLIAAKLLPSEDKQAAVEKISSHVGAVEVINNLLEAFSETKQAYEQKIAAAGPGRPVSPTKVASASTESTVKSGGFVGRRHGAGELTGADIAMAEAFGIR